ncbi:MAG: galactokinase [Rhodospirillales bacterium]|nr:galactokinase [Alphaproteobacteria bacterium]MBL6948980.1 galactokinase [Rhodospirillales bacterium]
MIISRTPLRISIGGGGTDLPSYYKSFGGFVISAAINKHIYITVNRTFRPGYLLKYSRTEHAETLDDIQHGLLRETLRLVEIEPMVEVVSIADVPAGTGMGSSGSFTVGLLHALNAYKRRKVPVEDLANTANHLEMNILGEPCGKQDHYIAAYGGLTVQEYHPDGTVTISPLHVSEEALRDLRENLLLFFTGYSRSAAKILDDQKAKSEQGDSGMLDNLHFIKDLGGRIKARLEGGDVKGFADLMNEHWEHKKARSENISNDHVNRLYDLALDNGARGGKLVGAGSGGFLMFYADDKPRLRAAMTAEGLQEMDFSFDFDGSIIQLRR